LTVIGSFAQAIISKEVSNNQFEIATNQPNVKVSWEVKGVRNDAHMRMQPFVAEEVKSAAERGKYWDPAAHNQPESKRVSYSSVAGSSLEDVSPALKAAKAAPATTGGSLDQGKITPAVTVKTIDNEGSVAPDTKKAEVKATPAKSTGKESTDQN
jgi:hypothetical protein